MSSQSKQRITVRTKIIAGYAAILLCLAVSIFIVYNQLNEVQAESKYITTHDLEVHNLTNKIEKNLLDMETGQRGYIITGDASYLEPYRSGFNQWELNYDSLLRLISDNSGQIDSLQSIRTVIEEWIQLTNPLIEFKESGNAAAIKQFYTVDQGKQDMDQLRTKLETFRTNERSLTDDRLSNLEQGNQMLVTTLLSLFGVSILLSALIGWLLSRSIVRTIRNVTECVVSMSESNDEGVADLTMRIPVTTTDEVADLAEETNKLLDKLDAQNWVQRHSIELGSLLHGMADLNESASLIVHYMSKAMGAPYGALYVADPQQLQGRLTLAAAVGSLNPAEELLPSFAYNEGLVGRAAMEKEMLAYQVPDSYVTIASGMGKGSPTYLLLIPVLFEGKTQGVLEIAAFEAFDPRHMALANKASELLGGAIVRLFTQMQIQNLLRESQAMTEEMQAQTEELQVQTEELQTQQEELTVSNEQLGRQYELSEEKNGELSQIQEELKQYSEQLERTSQYKSEFLGNMSHELRTPLNSMLILSEMLSENPSGNLSPKEEEFARVIHSAGQDLLDLINDILDLTKIEAGKMDLLVDAIHMNELPESVFTGFTGIAQKHQLDFKMTCSEQVPSLIYTDERKLRQILKNLLSNAFKFTPKGGVTLEIDVVDSEHARKLLPRAGNADIIAFRVRDTGIGIDVSKHDVIFEAFHQADGTTSRQFGGTGLGLSISRELASLLGGTITLDSRYGSGSTFTLYIPSISPGDGNHSGSGLAQMREAVQQNPAVKADAASQQQTAAAADRRPDVPRLLAGRTILVVDDDIRNVYSLSNALEIEGADVLAANNGEEALQLLDERDDVDIVLMDIMMPVMDGYEATRQIRKHPLYAEIPVIALTAKAMMQDRDLCLAAGASDYISKPIAIEQLYSLLEVWMPKKKRV